MITSEQAADIRARSDAYNEWAKQFRKPNGWTVITAEEMKGRPVVITNEERGLLEQYDFVSDPPRKYTLYIDEKARTATTWTGDVLGSVGFGRAYEGGFGGTRQPVRIEAINGLEYVGTYYKGAGDYAHVRLTAASARDLAARGKE